MAKYRMYCDEVGNSDLGASEDPNHRYLSLTGVIVELDHVGDVLFPRIEELKKQFFRSHPDEPIILHRKELLNARHPFQVLHEPSVRAQFDVALLSLLRAADYRVITVAIDKLELRERYRVWRYDPYHYCLAVLVERFVMYLQERDAHGDVLAESRGGRDDLRLKGSFERLLCEGTNFIDSERLSGRLTSKQLKVKPKSNNIAGLQVADLVANPSFKGMLERRLKTVLLKPFGRKIFQVLELEKYHRKPSGEVDGVGCKRLP